jgi:hypothetical protein
MKILIAFWNIAPCRLVEQRWLGDVEADTKALGIKRWRIKAQDNKEWSAILREAKAKIKDREAREELDC